MGIRIRTLQLLEFTNMRDVMDNNFGQYRENKACKAENIRFKHHTGREKMCNKKKLSCSVCVYEWQVGQKYVLTGEA